MPKADKKSTIARQWCLLRILTVDRAAQGDWGRWDKASTLHQKLADEGFEVDIRTVQRDLKELMTVFPHIEVNDKNSNDYGWRWQKNAVFDIPGMQLSEALMINLSEMHLKSLMPQRINNGLQSHFKLAKDKLAKSNRSKAYKRWLSRIYIAPATQQLVPPTIKPDIQENIYRALFEAKQIKADYTPARASESKSYTLNPLGIINRDHIYYLVATAWEYEDITLYALHRFSDVERLTSAAVEPEGFNFDEAIEDGLAEFRFNNEVIKLVLKCDQSVINYLEESPLTHDQTIEERSDGFYVTALVNNTWQLQFWILSHCENTIVVEPESLREVIKQKLINAVSQYG